MTAERELTLGRRYPREELISGGGRPMREATIGCNRLDGRFKLVTVDSFEPGQMIYLGRGDLTAKVVSLYGESTEAGMGPEATGSKRDLRFDFVIGNRDTTCSVATSVTPVGPNTCSSSGVSDGRIELPLSERSPR